MAIGPQQIINCDWIFGRRPGVTIRVRNLQLREPNEEELRTEAERAREREHKLARESQLNQFYRAKFSNQLESIAIDPNAVVVRGRTSTRNARRVLIEIAPEIELTERADGHPGTFALDAQAGIRRIEAVSEPGSFELTLPRRTAAGSDRSLSRWALASRQADDRWLLASHWKYATHLVAANDLPALSAEGIKGMGGIGNSFPLEELVELGIQHITLNTPITHLMDSTPHSGWWQINHGNRTWYINPRRVHDLDQIVKFCYARNIIVSAVLLIPFGTSDFAKQLIHPEADRAGHYAMPNFTTAEGVAAYSAAIDFLASRYATADGEHGRICNWIIHNEVGYGWEWTNMGRQPAMLYMDHYLRSMRLVHNIARRYDPHARVFISLTHHWNTPNAADWKSYSNRVLVQRLIESSQLEGDFAWGVAYHPYPQNLRRPDAWNDTRVTFDFDTPLITPKNIEVLDRWMHEPEMLDAKKQVRGVLLSEQGFNTPDYSQASQRLQAAGYVYMWRQLEGLKSIEAFHNHRWVDHPREGGLLLGVRKLPAGGLPYGEKKLGWHIYQALDSPREREVTSFADELIGPPRLPAQDAAEASAPPQR